MLTQGSNPERRFGGRVFCTASLNCRITPVGSGASSYILSSKESISKGSLFVSQSHIREKDSPNASDALRSCETATLFLARQSTIFVASLAFGPHVITRDRPINTLKNLASDFYLAEIMNVRLWLSHPKYDFGRELDSFACRPRELKRERIGLVIWRTCIGS